MDAPLSQFIDGLPLGQPRRKRTNARNRFVAGHPASRSATHRMPDQHDRQIGVLSAQHIERPVRVGDGIGRVQVIPAAYAVAQKNDRQIIATGRGSECARNQRHPPPGCLPAPDRFTAAFLTTVQEQHDSPRRDWPMESGQPWFLHSSMVTPLLSDTLADHL